MSISTFHKKELIMIGILESEIFVCSINHAIINGVSGKGRLQARTSLPSANGSVRTSGLQCRGRADGPAGPVRGLRYEKQPHHKGRRRQEQLSDLSRGA